MNTRVIDTKATATVAANISHHYVTKDGRKLQLRLIQAADADRLVDFFYLLSPESRWRRFHIATEHLDQATVQARAEGFATVDNWQQGGAVVALYCDQRPGHAAASDASGQIVGVARLARTDTSRADTPRADTQGAGLDAEIAVVVRDDFQQQGVGHALLQQLVRLARQMEITHLHADIQADNAPALRILKKLGLPITTQTHHAQTQTTLVVQ